MLWYGTVTWKEKERKKRDECHKKRKERIFTNDALKLIYEGMSNQQHTYIIILMLFKNDFKNIQFNNIDTQTQVYRKKATDQTLVFYN